jgi:hypothetical protein
MAFRSRFLRPIGSASRSAPLVAPSVGGVARMVRAAVRCVLIMGIAMGTFAYGALAQTVSITNTTRGGSTTFYVGDSWRVDVTGAPNQPVTVSANYNGTDLGTASEGQTDGNGQFTLTGTMDSSVVGNWTEVWYVGGVAASPTLSFTVIQPPPGCDGYSGSAPPVMYSVDY